MEESRCGRKRWSWVVVMVVVGVAEAATVVDSDDNYKCGPGITTPGVTVPAGDITLKVGSPLEIFCKLSPSVVAQGFNSSSLVFYHTSRKLPPPFVNVVNESTARLYIKEPVPMKDMFYCKLQNGTEEMPVCLNSVAVGYEPQPVLNFTCVSQNWDNLNCTWVPPQNFVKTKYTLFYTLPGRSVPRMKFPCPHDTDIKGKNYCFWDQTTLTPYRQPYEYYKFNMTGENIFGLNSTGYRFHHYAHVIPTKAANLTMLEKTSSSVMIQWSVVFPMQNFPPGVDQRVEYQSEWDDRHQWTVVDTSKLNIKNATHQLNITGLKYPNSWYDLRVFMRSHAAARDNMWSQPATLTIKTKPTIPGAAPKTDIGSFEVTTVSLTSRDVYVYWQHIPDYLWNGDEPSYRITVEEDGVPRNLKANETTSAYAKFKGLSMNSYRFRIWSTNAVGDSKDFSEVFVPSQHSKTGLAEPLSFTKIAFDHQIYELSWKPPISNQPISSYTIFWCDNKKDRPYQCTGTLNWTRVSKDETIKNITVPDEKIYQFAISANTETESSGMVWASCTVIHNRILGKMKSIWINQIGPTFIEVGWKLECSDRIGVVTGFQISYCPIVSPHNTQCKVEAKNTTIKGDGLTMRGNVTDLTPYTTYMVMVAVITKHSIGQWSDRQYNTTLEAAPDMPPQNVTISDVTNTTMRVQWSPPPSMNGVLRYYLVKYNGLEKEVDSSQQNPVNHVVLQSLESYVVYSVTVQACTVACSQPSPPLHVRTKIGIPGKMERPSVRVVNESLVEVTWTPPAYAAGLLDRYEVLTKVVGEKHNATEVLNCTGNRSQIPVEDCTSGGPHYVYSFSVRAVNYDNSTAYYGPWSEAGEGSCYNSGPKDELWIIMWVVVGLFFVIVLVAFAFLGKRLWRWLKNLKDVQVIIPPGLAPMEKFNNPDDLKIYGWGSPPIVEKQELGTPDQELLLEKKGGEERMGEERGGDTSSLGDGDSSGCSSGHESVASSLTHGTHISSDSGTEADQLHTQRATSLDGVFHDGSPPTSLRQRNKTSSSTSSESSSGRWEKGEPYVMLGGSTSCLVKSTPNLTEVEGGYSLLGTSWHPTPNPTGYVSLPPFKAEPAPVPAPAPTPAKGYVMAGESSDAPQYCRLGHSDYLPHRQLDGAV